MRHPKQRDSTSLGKTPESERWNRNIHYHTFLLNLGPADRVLDIGCGGGTLTRQLAKTSQEVVGIDLDSPSIIEAQTDTDSSNVSYVLGDFFSHPFEPESFDLVVSVAALHHFDASAGLTRMAELTKPGGTVGLVGIGRSEYPRDLARDALSASATFLHRHIRRKKLWDHNAPIVWPPPLTDAGVRELAAEVLPESVFRRRIHGRHTLVWTKPGRKTSTSTT